MPTKSKITSYIASHRSASASVKADNVTTYEWFDPKLKDEVYNPDPERMIGTVLTRLMSYPGQTLPREYNGFLLHVIESYRIVKHDLRQVQALLEAEREDHETITDEFGRVGRLWATERDKLKAEVKRMESLIEEGRKEMAALLGARQASIGPSAIPTKAFKQTAKGVIQEEVAKLNANVDLSGSFCSERRVSQSRDMTALSRTLEVDGHSAELPFGTPPSRDSRSGFAAVQDSPLRGKSNPASSHTTPSKISTIDWSDEDMSSSGGDRLPDEANSARGGLNAANDMDFLLQVTKWIADKRGVDPTEVFPQVAELLLSDEEAEGKALPDTPQSIRIRQDKPLPSLPSSTDNERVESILRPSVPRRRLTGDEILNNSSIARPRAVENLSPTDIRRFSFMPGDDTAPSALGRWPATDCFPRQELGLKEKNNAILTAVSTGSPPLHRTILGRVPVESRPSSVDTTITVVKKSNIPSPVTDYSITSPRRDDSGSNKSVVTAIRDNSGKSTGTPRRNSLGSLAGSDGLEDPIRRLRPESAALAAAKAATDGRSSPIEVANTGNAGPGRQSSQTGSESHTTSADTQTDLSSVGGKPQAEKRRGKALSPDIGKKATGGGTAGSATT
ncbi:MAG: hypothetical protein M1835_000029 [Candelina submexicana]|nr:MAG: hypothetical protein M1835_000029 [Candelina submexicana]